MTDIEPLLVAYVDGELDEAAVAEVERILADDPEARRSVAIYRETAALLRAACSESVYATSSTALRMPAPVSRTVRWRIPLAAVAAVALLAVGFGAGWMAAPYGDQDGFIDDVAEYHNVYSRETTHLAEVPASQSGEISRWLGGLLQRDVAPPNLDAVGLHFAGARLWISDGKPVADFLYTRANAMPVAFCMVHESDSGGSTDIKVAARGDLHVAYWRSAGYTYAVVGDLTPAQARTIAEHARQGV